MHKIVLGIVCVFSFSVAQVEMYKPLPMTKTLKINAESMNTSLPVMIDVELRYDKLEVKDNTMILKFTLVNFTVEDMNATNLTALMEADIRKNVCTDVDTQDIFKKDITVVYDYNDKNQKYITQFKYDAKVCGLESNVDKLKNILNLTEVC